MWSWYHSPRSRRRRAALGAALLVAVLAGAAVLFVWPKPQEHSGGGSHLLGGAAAITCRVKSGGTLRCQPATSDAARPMYRLSGRLSHLAPATSFRFYPARDRIPGAHQSQIPLTWPTGVACPDRPRAKAWLCVPVSTVTLAPARDVALYFEQP